MKHDARVHLLAFVSSFSLVAASGCTGDDTAGRETAGSGGSAGAAAAGGQTAAGAGSSAAGSGGAGSSGSSGASAGSGGAGAGAAGSAGRAGGGGASGAGTGGTSGMNAAGTSGATAGGGAAGAAVSGGRTYSTDRATFFGASRCAAAGVLLCDDFESGTIDAATWKNYQTAPKIDALQAARGTKALHVTTAATGGSGLRTTKIFPRTDGLYYGRMFIYFTALPTGPNYAHWTVIGSNAASDSTDKSELRVGGQLETINKFGVGTDHGPTGDWTNLDKDKPSGASSVREVPKNEWICLEWMVDTANELTKFWWDGTEHPSLATTRDVSRYNSNGTKYVLPDISSVWVGFENYNQGGTMLPANYDVWIDEVALDPQRIGCSL